MTNILEVLKDVVEDSTKKPQDKDPMHTGEVANLWIYYTMLEESNRYVEIALNTTKDEELIEALEKGFDNCADQIDEITKLFKEEGIPIPPTSETKTKSDPDAVPAGAKMTDGEIANGLSVKSVSLVMMCSTGLSQSIRSDVSIMWTKFLATRIKFMSYLKVLMKKRGWLKVPPLYHAPGSPNKK